MGNNELLDSLKHVRWQVARNTYGSSHCTLIGLLVDWWISENPLTNSALESGPSFGYRPRAEKGGGQCDAVLMQGGMSKGIIEVEGGYQGGTGNIERYLTTIEKIGKYFAAEHEDFQSLEFGIFLAYPTRKEYMTNVLPLEQFVEYGLAVTKAYSGKQLAILTLEKKWERQLAGPRARNFYYEATPYEVRGKLLENGKVIASSHITL